MGLGRIIVVVVSAALVGCPSSSSNPSSASAQPVRIVPDGTVTAGDVFRAGSLGLRVVSVRRRQLSTHKFHFATDPVAPDYRIATRCGDIYCIDGFIHRSQLNAAGNDLGRCSVYVERSGPHEPPAKTMMCAFESFASSSRSREERLAEERGAWVEVRIKPTHSDSRFVSFYRAEVWNASTRLHSGSEVTCHTREPRGVTHLHDLFLEDELADVIAALNAHTGRKFTGAYKQLLVEAGAQPIVCVPAGDDQSEVERLRIEVRY